MVLPYFLTAYRIATNYRGLPPDGPITVREDRGPVFIPRRVRTTPPNDASTSQAVGGGKRRRTFMCEATCT